MNSLKALLTLISAGALGLPAARASDEAAVSFLCRNSFAGNTPVLIEGTLTGPVTPGRPESDTASGILRIRLPEQAGNGRVAATGTLLGPTAYRNPATGQWKYLPMRVFARGRLGDGREVSGGFHLGLGSESWVSIGLESHGLKCNFASAAAPPRPAPVPVPIPTASPAPGECRREIRCGFRGGRDGGNWRCWTVCGSGLGRGGRPLPR